MRLGLLSFALLFVIFPVNALGDPVASAQFLDKDGQTSRSFAVGELLTVEISVRGGQPDQIWTLAEYHNEKWLRHGPLLLNYFSLEDPDARRDKVRVEAIALQPGQVDIPPFSVRAEGTDAKIETEPTQLKIQSALTQKGEKPVWILPPVPVFGTNKTLVYSLVALALLLLIALGYMLWRFIRARRPAQTAPDPHLEFKKRLSEIQQRVQQERLNEQNWKQISYAMTAAIKRYCSERLAQNLMDNTDSEFLDNMRREGLDQEEMAILERAFNSTNEVRYGTKAFDQEVALKIVSDLQRLPEFTFASLEQTKPGIVSTRGPQ